VIKILINVQLKLKNKIVFNLYKMLKVQNVLVAIHHQLNVVQVLQLKTIRICIKLININVNKYVRVANIVV